MRWNAFSIIARSSRRDSAIGGSSFYPREIYYAKYITRPISSKDAEESVANVLARIVDYPRFKIGIPGKRGQ
jgi:hypothetical protein